MSSPSLLRCTLIAALILSPCAASVSLAAAVPKAHLLRPRTESATPPTSAVNFGTVSIGTASTPASLVFTFDSSGSIGSVSVLTLGAAGLDFTDAGTGTCTTNGSSYVYGVGATCTVNVTFTPTLPGARYGAAILLDSSGDVIATAYIQGVGSGPNVSFLPPFESIIGSSSSGGGIAIDGAGDVYISDANNNLVKKETPSGSGYTESVVVTGLNYPGSVTVDGAGNLYIGDTYNNRVLKEIPSGSGYTQMVIGSGMDRPNAVAVDGSGNLYVADALNGRVLLETLSDGSYMQTDIFDCGSAGSQSCPSGVAVDGSGDLFITAYDSGSVLELTPSAGGGYTQRSIGSGLDWPSYIVIDGLGNLYIADTFNNRAVEEALTATGYVQSVIPSSSLNWPWAVAVDSSGNVFIADTYDGRTLKEAISKPPTLNFGAVQAGSPGVTKTVSVLSSGNAPLIFPVPGAGANPAISDDFTLNTNESSACPVVEANGSPATLTAGQTCQLSVTFAPTSEESSGGTLVLTDNALNAPSPQYTTQSITLIGTTGTAPSETVINVSAAVTAQSQPVQITATVVAEFGATTPTGTVTFSGLGQPAPVVNLNAGGSASFITSALAAGSYAVSAVYSGDGNYAGSASPVANFAITSGPGAQVAPAAGQKLAMQYGSGEAQSICAKVTDSSGRAIQSVPVGFGGDELKFTHASVLTGTTGEACSGVTPLAAGLRLATASVKGISTTAHFNIAVSPAHLVVDAKPQERTYGAANPELTYAVTGLAKTDTINVIAGTTATIDSLVGKYPITLRVTGAALANYTLKTAGSVLTVLPAPLVVRPDNYSSVYGQKPAKPARYSITGFVNGENESIVIGAPRLMVSATSTSPAGTYPVSASIEGMKAPNYIIRSEDGALIVNKARLIVKANNLTIRQGQSIPKLRYTLTGFVNHDKASTAVEGDPTLTTTATSRSPVGSYTITLKRGSLKSPNYDFDTEDGTLTIEP
jgi:sugar lactone lactonase YvrE